MAKVQIKLPNKLIPVFAGKADVRGAFGGRGSGKTRSFAKIIAVRGYIHGKAGERGQLLCARQFMNSLDDSSLEECKRAIEEEPFLSEYYEVGDKFIRSRDGRIEFTFAGLDRSVASIKSKGRILVCWVDEAEPVTEDAWQTLEPTLREEGDGWNAELWVTWNPKRKSAAVEKRYRQSSNPLIKLVELNWTDNPMFPEKLRRQKDRDFEERPDQYAHIWEGEYATALAGSYYAKHLSTAKQEGRIGKIKADPLMTLRAFVDIGGTGARADSFVIWIAQFVGLQIRVLDHYEAVGQDLGTHLTWMRSKGYVPEKCAIWLPHDGASNDKVYNVSYETALRGVGYSVTVVPNQGRGAAKQRVESTRRLFPSIWFNDETTVGGREALGFYHEKKDDTRNLGLGPEHDWASNSADAFGLMCVVYQTPQVRKNTVSLSTDGINSPI